MNPKSRQRARSAGRTALSRDRAEASLAGHIFVSGFLERNPPTNFYHLAWLSAGNAFVRLRI